MRRNRRFSAVRNMVTVRVRPAGTDSVNPEKKYVPLPYYNLKHVLCIGACKDRISGTLPEKAAVRISPGRRTLCITH